MEEKRVITATELREYAAQQLAKTQRMWLRSESEREGNILQGRAQVWEELDRLPVTLALLDEQERELKDANPA